VAVLKAPGISIIVLIKQSMYDRYNLQSTSIAEEKEKRKKKRKHLFYKRDILQCI